MSFTNLPIPASAEAPPEFREFIELYLQTPSGEVPEVRRAKRLGGELVTLTHIADAFAWEHWFHIMRYPSGRIRVAVWDGTTPASEEWTALEVMEEGDDIPRRLTFFPEVEAALSGDHLKLYVDDLVPKLPQFSHTRRTALELHPPYGRFVDENKPPMIDLSVELHVLGGLVIVA